LPIQSFVSYFFFDKNILFLALRLIASLFLILQFIKRCNDAGIKPFKSTIPFYMLFLVFYKGETEIRQESLSENEADEKIRESRKKIESIEEKVKKNLVYVGIFSVIMLFAGFTSAYIVSMGDSFWLKYPLPTYFWISTLLIILSSLFLEIAIRKGKSKNKSALRIFISATLIAGLAFVYFQFKGYGALTDNGIHAANNHIMVVDGRYGDYYQVKFKGEIVEVDGNNYLYKGKVMNEQDYQLMSGFMKQFIGVTPAKLIQAKSNPLFDLIYIDKPISILNNKLVFPDSTQLKFVDQLRLSQLAQNIIDKRVDFFVRGKYGKDFQLLYKGKELEYKNRNMYFEGKKLSKYLQIKALETADAASSYLFILTFIHLLHIIVTLIYMIKVTINSYSGKYDNGEVLSLRLGAIFWHFLAILWGYLLLFLLFIH
jgi:cytochrome c oxidase subunit 3